MLYGNVQCVCFQLYDRITLAYWLLDNLYHSIRSIFQQYLLGLLSSLYQLQLSVLFSHALD